MGSRFFHEGERKHVTILFADIRGSTELIHDLDPEHGMQRLEPVLQAMVQAVRHYGGTVNHMRGDGIMAVFGAPLAFEDHAVRACLAAHAMIHAVSRLDEDPVGIRIGLDSGEVVVRSIGHDLSVEYDAVGPTTHLANRMEQLAEPGTAWMTAHTAHLVAGSIQVDALGPVEIKGLSRRIEAFRLVGPAGQTRWQVRAAAHSLSTFVGRGTEIRVLSDALHRASVGRGQIVAIAGEAGMGKSRLVHEFLKSPSLDGMLQLRNAAMPHDRSTPYQLIAGMLRFWLGVTHDDVPAGIDQKLTTEMSRLGHGARRDLAPLRFLLDLAVEDSDWDMLDVVQRRSRIHEAVRSLVLQVAVPRTLIIVVEDLHWADIESQSVLDFIMDGLGSVPLLIILSYRPEYQHRWVRHSYYSFVQLGPLDHSACEWLLRGLLGDAADLDGLRQRIIEQTDGTPLFLEEVARSLVETGVLISEPLQFRLTRRLADVEVPESVQIVLASRIDRLPAEARTLLQVASVIGKDVPVMLLQAVAEVPPDRLARQLLELRSLEFLHEVRDNDGVEYAFKHALTHAVAYDSMLKRHRRTLHADVMAAIEKHFPERLAEFTERLADHAMLGEVWDKAVRYCYEAGQRANRCSAHRAATMFFERALEAAAHLPDSTTLVHSAIEIRLGLRVALVATGELERVRQYLHEAEALAHSINDDQRLMPILVSKSTVLINLGALDEAIEAGLQGRTLALALNDEACVVSSGFALGQAYWNRGELLQAEDVLSSTVRTVASQPLKQHFGTTGTASVLCLVSLSHTHSLLGQSKQAFSRSEEALELARRTERPYDLSYAHAAQGLAHLTAGELAGAIRHLEEALSIARSNEILLLVPHAVRFLGRAYALTGRFHDATALLTATIEQARSQSLMTLHAWCVAALGHTRMLEGAVDEAETLLGEAFEFAQRQGYRPLEVYALRLLGSTEASRNADPGAASRAETWFRIGAGMARQLGIGPELAHCHHGLADVLAGMGRHTEAQTELAAARVAYEASGMTGVAAGASARLLGSTACLPSREAVVTAGCLSGS